jgi:uncharacterized repeat protein (TIGR01451 family)
MSFSPTALSFGPVRLGESSLPQSVVIQTVGFPGKALTYDGALNITGLQLSGPAATDFTIIGTSCVSPLSYFQTCQFSVAFSPHFTGNRQAIVSILSNDPVSPNVVTLTGIGYTEADLSIGISASSYAVRNGRTVTYSIAVTNNGPDFATQVRMSDILPPNLVFVSLNAPEWVCSRPPAEYNGAVNCRRGNIPAGQTSFISITARVVTSERVSITNFASVTTTSFNDDPADNYAGVAISARK